MNEDNMNQEFELYDMGMDGFTDKAKDTKKATLRLLKYLAKQRLKILVIVLTVLIGCILNLAGPLVMGKVIDQLYEGIKLSMSTGQKFNPDSSEIVQTILILMAIYGFTSLFTYFQQYFMAGVAQKLTLGLRKELSQKLNNLPLSYYDSHKKGEILSRATSDLERIADSLQQGLMQFILSTVTIVVGVIIMMVINPILTLITVATIIISMLVTKHISQRVENYYGENQRYLGELNSDVEEAFTGQLVIKAFSGEERAIESFQAVNQKLCDANRKAQFSIFAIEPIIRVIGKMGYVIVAVAGGSFAVKGTMTLGQIQAFIQYVDICSEPMTQLSYIMNMLQSAIASAERFFELLDETEELPDNLECKIIENPKGNVVFDHVRFGYREDAILMKDINLNLKSGSKIAIVGPTGAGKTTLVNLLMRFYEIQGGKITIDGIDIKDMSRASLRTLFGMVLQDTWIFHGSIYDNIAYGRLDASMEEVVSAAKAARADHFIRTFPKGYQTILDEDGSNISQGQKQLLTIARAIIANPPILILDEATSSVDTRTEAEIQKAMKNLMQDRTSFIIAHRLSTIRDADLILVMQNGNITEQGTHQELLERKGLYESLYNSQFAPRATLI